MNNGQINFFMNFSSLQNLDSILNKHFEYTTVYRSLILYDCASFLDFFFGLRKDKIIECVINL